MFLSVSAPACTPKTSIWSNSRCFHSGYENAVGMGLQALNKWKTVVERGGGSCRLSLFRNTFVWPVLFTATPVRWRAFRAIFPLPLECVVSSVFLWFGGFCSLCSVYFVLL